MIQKISYPRVSIAGNPSDGFWGKCLSMSFLNYSAQCTISSSESFILQREYRNELDLEDFSSLDRLLGKVFPVENTILTPEVEENKLALSVIKTFFDFCMFNRIEFERKPFRVSYSSTIPYSLGFSGSTAVSVSILISILTTMIVIFDLYIHQQKRV